MPQAQPALSRLFANLGHSYSHILTILFPTVVLALERHWGLSYGELIALMLAGQILFGVAALPAGWLGDRWSSVGMMVVFFLGSGAAAIVTGFARGPIEIAVGLALIGLFASIYHPVGMAWLLRNAESRGRALGANGVYGSVGLAIGPMIAGVLTDLVSWRAAFIVPGASACVLGLALWILWRLGYVVDAKADLRPQVPPTRDAAVRAFFILSLTMTCVGFVGQAFQVMLPKLFAERLPALGTGGTLGAGTLVTLVYLGAACGQYVGGRIADRWGMRRLYFGSYLLFAPLLLASAATEGWPLVVLMVVMLTISVGALPAENGLLAHFTPPRWRATAYGAKFVLALGIAALATPAVGAVHDATGGFYWIFLALAAIAATVALCALLLPDDRSAPAKPQAQPAE